MNMSEPRLEYVRCISRAGFHRMAYWEWGDPSNERVLLCLHGLTRTGRDFDRVAQALQDQYRVICPDLVGRGASEFLSDPMLYELPQYVADMVTLMARLESGSLSFIGTGLGGLIGMSLAGWSALQVESFQQIANVYSLPQHVFLFERMVFNDIGPKIESLLLSETVEDIHPRQYDSFDQALKQIRLHYAECGELSTQEWELFAKAGLYEDNGRWSENYDPNIKEPLISERQEASFEKTSRMLWNAYLHITCPILILRGESSRTLSAKEAKKMLLQNSNAELKTLEGSGHFPPLVRQSEITLLKDFLSR